jgi:hypothetical protein
MDAEITNGARTKGWPSAPRNRAYCIDHTSHGAAGEVAATARRASIISALLWAIKASL